MKARMLNKSGQRDFSRMIDGIRAGQPTKLPSHIINDPYAVEDLDFEVEVSAGGFVSRYEIGEHLVEALADVERSRFISNRGFWDWLALQWFDDLCPLKADGTRKPSEVASYVMSDVYNRRYRHAVYVTWQLVDTHRENARVLLFKKPSVRGELTEQLMARQYYLSSSGLIEAAKQLYWDDRSESFKKGAAGKGSGSVRRLIKWLQQIEVNYDLFTISAERLLELAPPEFQKFLK